jgi:hypothetical protein
MRMRSESDALRSSLEAPHALAPKARQPKAGCARPWRLEKVLARLRLGVAKPQVKHSIVVSDPYRLPVPLGRVDRAGPLTEDAAQAFAVPRHPPVGPIRHSREGVRERGDRRAGGQQSCELRDGLAA